MNVVTAKADAKNALLQGRIFNSLDAQKVNGTLTDDSINQTFLYHIDFVFNTSGDNTQETREWRLQIVDELQIHFAQYYTPGGRARFVPRQYDGFSKPTESDTILDKLRTFNTAFAAEADKIISPNLGVISFVARNAVVIGLVLVVGYVVVANRKTIAASLDLAK